MRKGVKVYLFQVLVLASLVVLYDVTRSFPLLIGVIALISGGYIIYGLYFKIRPLPYLEKIVNPSVYMEYIESKVKRRVPLYYPLYKAYGLIYQNKLDEAVSVYQENTLTIDDLNEDLFRVYTLVEAHIYYYQNNKQALINLEKRIEGHKHRTFAVGQTIVLFRHLIDEEYYKAKELLLLLIPEYKTRLHIVEMEYYLALAYGQLDNKEDALAVIDFMLDKNYPVFYTNLFKELKERITENEEA
ncbi:MAG: hypothetical protein UMR38_07415 [Candidatus Izemoplasma sp.]|nr:hypothetical protein [Candidatus Izemoplasma sp.]